MSMRLTIIARREFDIPSSTICRILATGHKLAQERTPVRASFHDGT